MHDQVSAIMLAGTILPTPFQEALGLPVLCLPIGPGGSVLDAWRRVLGAIDRLERVKLVVRSAPELEHVSAVVRADAKSGARPTIETMRDPGAWRGVAGVLHDLTAELLADAVVVVCEAHCHPPNSLAPLIDAMSGDTAGVVGTTEGGEPAGVYAFRGDVFRGVSEIGYCDLKEQLLPMLYAQGRKVVARPVSRRVERMRDLESYLDAVRASLTVGKAGNEPTVRIAAQARVSRSAILDGFCIVEPGAVIEDGVVLHDAVVLSGAIIGGGAVVSRSVIGPMVRVNPRTQIVRDVVATPADVMYDVLSQMAAGAGSVPAA